MTAHILDGRAMGAEIRAELREEIRRYVQEQGHAPGLVIVLVGSDDASGMYSKAILRVANDIGISARLEQLPANTSSDELHALLLQLNADAGIQG
ncbi:MAG TPA: tetrahydrofolate dehydrogenase/cyclohydrolase catalytic domain-containing protein, partial [Ktedonobacteraceae bacterium]|nr:tetrahydrofolate dehydrogenase/cyclohydrolase catalytic domain-containing protein [Ktedonobacteraceae bacterium]